jgi:SAM-dependent methyltransferase
VPQDTHLPTTLLARPSRALGELIDACPCCGGRDTTQWLRVPKRNGDRAHIYELLYCVGCSHIWLGNRPTPEEMSVHYQDDYQQAVSRSGEIYPVRWKWHLRGILRYKTEGSVLDIGCSSGGFLASLKGGHWKLHGIEYSPATADRARSATGGDIFAGDVLRANFRSQSFDLITCMDVLEHLYEPRDVLRKVSEWLKPGGVFYVFVPNIHSWEARLFRSYWYGLDLPRHVQHFSTRSLTELATSVGLRPIRIVTPAGNYLEEDFRILSDDVLRRMRLRRAPLDWQAEPMMLWKVIRKGVRLTAGKLFSNTAALFGGAASIQAVFARPVDSAAETELN